jgi:DNA-binding NarL/FixJ family response regulator
VLLVDDHAMLAEAVAAVIGDAPDIEVVGVVTSPGAAEAVVAATPPDVIVMDYQLGGEDGIAATRRMREISPQTSVLMMSAFDDDGLLAAALAAGCCGFVAKTSGVDELLRAIRAAAVGDAYFSASALEQLVGRANPSVQSRPLLSVREQEVLMLLGNGESTAAIISALGLSAHTVRNHIRNLLAKLDAHSKLEAVVIATRLGLLSPPDANRR